MSLKNIKHLVVAATAENTRKSYEADRKYFWAWAKAELGIEESYPVPVQVLEQFVEDHITGLDEEIARALVVLGFKSSLKDNKAGTVDRKVKAINWQHKVMGFEPVVSGTIRTWINAGKRMQASQGRVVRKKRAITAAMLEKMINTLGSSIKEKRDKAILAFAFYTGGRRRSEISQARVEYLTKLRGRYEYWLHKNKTDQLGKGFLKILRQPHANHLTAWLEAAGIRSGYLFRRITPSGIITDDPVSGQSINRLVKTLTEEIGEDPKLFGAHSIRRGFLTECGRRSGVSIEAAMECSGHCDIRTAYGYYQQGQMQKNPATKL